MSNWLVTRKNQLADLESQVNQLKIIAKELPEIDNFPLLLLELIRGTQGPESVDMDEATFNKLSEAVLKLIDFDENPLTGELGFLSYRFSELQEQKPSYNWKIIERQFDRQGNLGTTKVAYQLVAGIQAAMSINTFPELPPAILLRPSDTAHLSLVFEGRAMLTSGASVSNGFIKFGLNAGASKTGKLSYFFGQRSDSFVADALAENLSNLVPPFDLNNLHEKLVSNSNLRGLKLSTKSNLNFGGELGFAVGPGFKLTDSGSVTAQVDYSFKFSAKESGEFDYLITLDKADPSCLSVSIKRSDQSIKEDSKTLSVGIDMTGWAEKTYPKVRKHLTEADEFFDQLVDGYLPGQKEIQSKLRNALNDALVGSEYASAIKTALGFSQEHDIKNIIEEKILPKLESSSSIWASNVNEAASGAVSEMLSRVDLEEELEKTLQSKFQEMLSKHLEEIQGGLVEKIKKFIGSKKENPKWEKAVITVNEIGSNVQKSIEGLDNRITEIIDPIREELNRIQRRLAMFAVPFEDASKAKVLLGFESYRREEVGKSLDIEFVIDPQHDDANDILQMLINGDIGSQLKNDHSEAIKFTRGTFERYKQLVKKQGFNIVLFNIGFSGSTNVKIDSRIRVDAQGNIALVTSQELERLYNRENNTRRLRMVNSHEVGTSGLSKDMTVNFAIIMEHSKLNRSNLTQFLKPFEDLAMLPAGSTSRAANKLPGDGIQGNIELSLPFNGNQLDILFSQSEETVLREGARVYAELVQSYPVGVPLRNDLPIFLDMIKGDWGLQNIDIGTAIVLMHGKNLSAANSAIERAEESRKSTLTSVYDWLDYRHASLIGRPPERRDVGGEGSNPGEYLIEIPGQPGLHDALLAMKEIRSTTLDFSYPELSASERRNIENQLINDIYSKQEFIEKGLSRWHYFGLDADWWLLNKQEPRLFTMALFTLLARLSAAKPSTIELSPLVGALTLSSATGTSKRHPIL